MWSSWSAGATASTPSSGSSFSARAAWRGRSPLRATETGVERLEEAPATAAAIWEESAGDRLESSAGGSRSRRTRGKIRRESRLFRRRRSLIWPTPNLERVATRLAIFRCNTSWQTLAEIAAGNRPGGRRVRIGPSIGEQVDNTGEWKWAGGKTPAGRGRKTVVGHSGQDRSRLRGWERIGGVLLWPGFSTCRCLLGKLGNLPPRDSFTDSHPSNGVPGLKSS